MKICVFGLWHLGSVTSACLASLGHQVIGFDDDANTVKKLNSAIAPVFEKGLDVPTVKLISGHKNPMVLLNTYTKLNPEKLVSKLG